MKEVLIIVDDRQNIGARLARLIGELEMKGQIAKSDPVVLTGGIDLANGDDKTSVVVIDSITGLEEELLKDEIGRVDGFRIVEGRRQTQQIKMVEDYPYEPKKKKAQWKTERQPWGKR